MRIRRKLGAERGEDLQLLRRVGNVVLATDHVRNPVEHVLERRDEVVGRPAVRADENDVLELLVRVFDRAENQVVPGRGALVGHAKADRAVVLVGLLVRDELVRDFLRVGHPVELERHLTVPLETEPAQRLLDLLRCCLDFPARVRVFDPQQELAAFVAGEQPVEERGVDAADVQEAGRTRRKADSDGHGSSVLRCPGGFGGMPLVAGVRCLFPGKDAGSARTSRYGRD